MNRIASRILVLLTLLPAVTAATQPAKAPPQTLVVVTAHPQPVRDEFEAAFNAALGAEGLSARILWIDQGGSLKNARYIRQKAADVKRQAAADVGIDLIWGGGSELFRDLARDGLLDKLTAPDAAALVPGAADPSGQWIGTAMSSFGVLVDRQALAAKSGAKADQKSDAKSDTALTWSQLAAPALAGALAIGDPRASAVSSYVVPGLYRKLGWSDAWKTWTGLVANSPAINHRTSEVLAEVTSGAAVAGIAIDFLGEMAAAKGKSDGKGRADALAFAVPSPQLDNDFDPIGKPIGAPHAALADRFIKFVLSEPGQRLISQPAGSPNGPKTTTIGRKSVLLALASTPGITAPARGSVEGAAALADKFVADMVGAVLVDQAAVLQAAWAGCAAAKNDAQLATLQAPPLTQAEAVALETKAQTPPARAHAFDGIKLKYRATVDAATKACAKK
jgi:ABC-type Fe3+ transport system substrate-binding protein